MRLPALVRSVSLILFASLCLLPQAYAESYERVVHELNSRISPGIDEQELAEILRSLNSTNNKRLTPKFVTKRFTN